MKYHILTVGLKNNLISWCQKYFSEKNTEVRIALDIKEVAQTIEKETFHLLVFDMDYLRSIGQSGWLLNIRNITFIPMLPVPALTPWGYTIRHRALDNGIYWIETDQCEEVLAVAHPAWAADLPKSVLRHGRQLTYDTEHGINHTLGYKFFSKK